MRPPDALAALRLIHDEPRLRRHTVDARPFPHHRSRPASTTWHVTGEAATSAGVQPFELVAKDVADGSPEPDLYSSGRLDDLGPLMRVPRLLAVTEAAGRRTMWLEYAGPLDPFAEPEWTRVAAALGEATSRLHRAGPLPALPRVIDHHRAAGTGDGWRRTEIDVALARSRPELVEPWYDPDVLDRIDRVLGARSDLIESMGSQVGLCHADCGEHNMGIVGDRLILYDWEEAANGPAGVDLAAFVNGSLVTGAVPGEQAFDFEAAAVAAYLDAFDPADRGEVMQTYRAHATLLWAPRIHPMRLLLRGTADDIAARYEMTADEFLQWRRTLTELFLVRAEAIL